MSEWYRHYWIEELMLLPMDWKHCYYLQVDHDACACDSSFLLDAFFDWHCHRRPRRMWET